MRWWRETRDLAVATRAVLDARIQADLQHHRHVESALSDMLGRIEAGFAAARVEREAAIGRVESRLGDLEHQMDRRVEQMHGRISEMQRRAIGWVLSISAIVIGLTIAALMWFLQRAIPWQFLTPPPT